MGIINKPAMHFLEVIFVFVCVLLVECKGGTNQPPTFKNDRIWQMYENEPVGSRPRTAFETHEIVGLRASDPDGDDLTFSIKGDSERSFFTVDSKTGIVKLRKRFDREVQSKYFAQFIVSDGIHEVVGNVDITILDVNDNQPMFDRIRYDVTIPENLPLDTEVFRVSATDPDTGLGGKVTYSIVEEDGPTPFQIDFRTGIIFLRENVDYEKTSIYRLIVAARDRDPINSLSSSVVVTISLEDVQDSNPVFQELPYHRRIDENTPLRTVVLTLKAIDGDRGQPNDISFSFVSGNEEGKFALSTGLIRVAHRIDRDAAGFQGFYQLTVRATELSTKGSEGGAFSETTFKIWINDLNDERPVFERKSYRLTLSENTPVGTSLPITIPVSDRDQDANSDVTMSVDWRSNKFITVSPVTFRRHANVTIILTKALDFETNRKRLLKIFANETNNPRQFTSCDVRIDILNENDNSPIFDQVHYQENISESTSLDSPVLRVHAEDADAGRFGRITYSVENSRGEIEINKISGDIRLLKELDYEESRMKQYVVTARDSGPSPLKARSLVTFNIMDENDNAPAFPTKLSDVFVRENTTEKRIATVKATDADSFPNDIISYSLSEGPSSSHFSIDTVDGVGLLNLDEPLDYESIEGGSFELTIRAIDSGFLITNARIRINVEDMNDQAPEFVQISNFTVRENIGGGMLVKSILADDLDSGKNGEISYYVTRGQERFDKVFQLNEHTGDITTKPGISPDFEDISHFEVVITAQDGGIPSLSVSQALRISVTDVNDNAPAFGQTVYETTVDENTRLRDFHVTAVDVDNGFNGAVRYFITDGNTGNLFDIHDVTGYIVNRKKLDYEQIGPKIELEVTAEDRGIPKRSSTAQIIINIVDVNDNAPVFQESSIIFRVMENTMGSTVGSVTASDVDSGKNGRIVYSITRGNDQGRFSISPFEGELRVTNSIELDREEQEIYNLTICATDSGSNPLSATIAATVIVGDMNDNRPEFIDLPKELSCSENRIGLAIYQLSANDRDAGNFGTIEYSMENEDGTFIVNPQTGVIDLVKSLDREVNDKYILHVTARDNPRSSRDSRSTKASLVVTVDDMNDEKPKFVGSIPYQASVPENSPPGTQVMFTSDHILAFDADEGENAVVTYAIEGKGSSYFSINPESGVLHTTTSLDRESLSKDSIDLTLRASDVGGLYSETVVVVTVTDVNDNAPRFKSRRMENVILESVQPGHVAARMTASDPDQGLNGQIFYRIRSGAYDKFAINADTGIIYLAPGQSLDRETKSLYKLIVVATDHAPVNTRSSTAVVIIEVDDVNDSRPKFTTNYQKLTIHENSVVGTAIARLTATDGDLDSDLIFTMTSMSIYDAEQRQIVSDESVDDVALTDNDVILNWFSLNATSGEISLASGNEQATATVDREVCSKVYLHFMVRDQASASEEMANALQRMTIQIDIVDQNDNSPILEVSTDHIILDDDEVFVDVVEECDIGTELFSVMGRDLDQGNNGKVVFELHNNVAKLVRLRDENSGTILSSARLDRESLAPSGGSGWINVTLVARDRGFVPSKSTRLLVRMRVVDINDNSPKFLQGFYEGSAAEDAPIGAKVTTVRATDKDDGDFGDVTYKILGALGYFKIHPHSGDISVTTKLDRERTEQHVFTVIAKDNSRGADESRDTSVQVTVTVFDVNDNAPVFIQPKQSTIGVFENIALGSSITMATATDPDAGSNGQVTYSLSAFADYFSINSFNGDVTVSRQIIASPHHPVEGNMTIIATDGGGKKASLTMQIEIIDVNDHLPVFHAPKFNVIRILEEQPGGLFVTQINATDDDLGRNGVVRYRLVDPHLTKENAFYLDDVTGRILTSRKLDREDRSEYTLVIEAHDLGSPSMQVSKILKIHLDDINDNRPVFAYNGLTGAFQSLAVSEDASVGSVIGHVRRATDRDENARIYYHILMEDGDLAERTFKMDGNKIVLKQNLDRETVNQYVLVIGATNNERFTQPFTKGRWDAEVQQSEPSALSLNNIVNPLSVVWDPSRDPTLLKLTIDVSDVIDTAPSFVRHRYVTAIEAKTEAGVYVGKITATDEDVRDTILYSIIRTTFLDVNNITSQYRNDFVINSHSGDITTASRITGQKGRYVVELQARDSINLTDTTVLTVHVLRGSRQLQFIVASPPDVVREQKQELSGVLRNLTGSIVIIDDISHYVTPDKHRDVTQSVVKIRIFDTKTSDKEIRRKIKGGTTQLQELFKDYSFYEIDPTTRVDGNDMILRVVVVILSLLIILLIIIFIVYITYMRRNYRNKLDKLRESCLDDITITSPQRIWRPPNIDEKEKSMYKGEPGLGDSPGGHANSVEKSRTGQRSFFPKQDTPTLASSLLWSPSVTRKASGRPPGASKEVTVDRQGVFEYDITLHATGNRSMNRLHGSDSGSSF